MLSHKEMQEAGWAEALKDRIKEDAGKNPSAIVLPPTWGVDVQTMWGLPVIRSRHVPGPSLVYTPMPPGTERRPRPGDD